MFFFFSLTIWQIAKFVPEGNDGEGPQPAETEQQPQEGQGNEEVAANSDGSTATLASSDALQKSDIVHVVGDIVHVRCYLTYSFLQAADKLINFGSPAYSYKE
jgi:hypothetical protein